MTDFDRSEIIGNRHHEDGPDADPVGHLITDCNPNSCGLVAMTSPLPGCEHPGCLPDPVSAVAVRTLDGVRYLLCAAHQWTDALALFDDDDRAALALVATDTPIARPDGLRERPMLLLAADPATGQVLGAWMDVAYSPGGLVDQIAGRHSGGEDMTRFRRDRAAWWLARVSAGDGDGIHVCIDTAALAAVADPGRFWTDDIGVCFSLTPTAIQVPAAAPPERRRSITERQAEQVQIVLGSQAAIITANPRAVFYGDPVNDPDVGDCGITDPEGRYLADLANAGLYKSPSGFAWGFTGSGAHAVARSVLAAALGPNAACPDCQGTTAITVPDGDGEGASEYACPACQDGIRDLPFSAYAHLVIAGLHGSWALTRGEVLRWLATHTDAQYDAVAIVAGAMLCQVPDGH